MPQQPIKLHPLLLVFFVCFFKYALFRKFFITTVVEIVPWKKKLTIVIGRDKFSTDENLKSWNFQLFTMALFENFLYTEIFQQL